MRILSSKAASEYRMCETDKRDQQKGCERSVEGPLPAWAPPPFPLQIIHQLHSVPRDIGGAGANVRHGSLADLVIEPPTLAGSPHPQYRQGDCDPVQNASTGGIIKKQSTQKNLCQ